MTRYYKGRAMYDCFNKPLNFDCGIAALNPPSMPIDDITWPPKYPDIPLIWYQLLFMLPLKTMLVPWIQVMTPQPFIYLII